MTQDEIIRMAREAGFDTKVFNSIDGDEVIVRHGNATSICISDELERFFNLAFTAGAANEREACAKVCDDIDTESMIQNWKSVDECAKDCAAAIRARGEK